ncbi:MAG: ABC transporter permease [Nitrosomonas sp.]|nr:ABC transporter permease [Nitrosomonas sp.]
MQESASVEPTVKIDVNQNNANELNLILSGNWNLRQDHPTFHDVESSFHTYPVNRIIFSSQKLGDWDSSLLILLSQLTRYAKERALDIDYSGLPNGVQNLLNLATTEAATQTDNQQQKTTSFITQFGQTVIDWQRSAVEMVFFLGETVLSLKRLVFGKAQFRRSDFFLITQEAGPQALGIVSLISFLVGLILAYIGALQLSQFGAQIFVADLVGIGMVREISALMTGIIVAGRTGAAFAAQLGTMQVNEEIDALKTLGISPIDFLVLPRLLALILMMPLLTMYSGIIGILAGAVVALTVFDIGFFEYYHQTVRALNLNHFFVGLFKGTVYGILVAYAGCLRGMQCGRSAQAVGETTTSAVVTGILLIVIFASLLTIIFHNLGI